MDDLSYGALGIEKARPARYPTRCGLLERVKHSGPIQGELTGPDWLTLCTALCRSLHLPISAAGPNVPLPRSSAYISPTLCMSKTKRVSERVQDSKDHTVHQGVEPSLRLKAPVPSLPVARGRSFNVLI